MRLAMFILSALAASIVDCSRLRAPALSLVGGGRMSGFAGRQDLPSSSDSKPDAAAEIDPTLSREAPAEALYGTETVTAPTLAGDKNDYTPEAEADRIKGLPGAPAVDFAMFGGYITVSEGAGRNLFYIMVEAEEDAASKPVVLWLNGGPGCSSLGGGFLAELGPFFPRGDAQTLYRNIYSWNKAANIIFLDSPAFVGFSYSNTPSDATVGDVRTAQDSREFLRGFYQRFPQYRNNELYISGESYAGHYIPNLAKEIVMWNTAAVRQEDLIPLKGFMLGNPWTDAWIDSSQCVVNLWHRGFLSDDTALGILGTCNFTKTAFPDYTKKVLQAASPLLTALGEDHPSTKKFHSTIRGKSSQCKGAEGSGRIPGGSSCVDPKDGGGGGAAFDDDECNRLVAHADIELGPINIYDLYVDVCNQKSHLASYHFTKRVAKTGSPTGRLLANTEARRLTSLSSWWPHDKKKKDDDDKVPPTYDPCVGAEVSDYLNRPDVQKAIHANVSGLLPGPWQECSDVVDYSDDDLMVSMLPTYRWLFQQAPDLRFMVYSGDVDGIVPILGTRTWIRELGMNEQEAFKPWYIVAQGPSANDGSFGMQVAGYSIKYKEMSFASIRDAGHMVPLTQPARALVLFQKFLNNEVL